MRKNSRSRARGFSRQERVGDLIQQALATIIHAHMQDARFRLVTVTGVDVSRDLSYAKVYVSLYAEDKTTITSTLKALNKAVKLFRYELAHAVTLRIVPELKFIYDESTAHGFKISGLIEDVTKTRDDS